MDPAHVERLKEEQVRAIQETQGAIEKLNNYIEDYEALNERLRTLPDKVTHDVMVPFGKLAFMPGKLVHTNEIMVLLGDNWFVERSAKQASEIVDRRIEVLKGQTTDLEKQKGLLEPRQEFTEELAALGGDNADAREIREEYDEESERQWRIAHRKKMREFKKQEREEREEAGKEASKVCTTDEDVWTRLEELERQERAGREMLRLDEELSQDYSEKTPVQNTVVQQDLRKRASDDEEEYGEESEELSEGSTEEEDIASPPNTIRFVHSKNSNNHGVKFSEGSPLSEEPPTIKSPADVYKMFLPDKPKSILKSPTQSTQPLLFKDSELAQMKNIGPTKQPNVPLEPPAFTDLIIERPVEERPVIGVESLQNIAPPPQQLQQEQQPRVSRFKAQRMKQQKQ